MFAINPVWNHFMLGLVGLGLALTGAAPAGANPMDADSDPPTARYECQANEFAKLTASDAAESDQFGYSVSISGDVAVIGAHGDDDGGARTGSAYVFRFDGQDWIEETKLTASDAESDDWFGWSVCISGDVAVIGAHGDDDEGYIAGSAYVFRFDGQDWIEEAKLHASDAADEDFFGDSVSISGDVIVIGAYGNDDAGSKSGSAYVFRFDGLDWIEQAKLTASDAEEDDRFGWSVSIDGDTAVIGAYGNDDAGSKSGSAYVFRFDGLDWIEQAKLTASDAAEDDRFGNSVSVSGDAAVIGAHYNSDGGSSSGSAYVFRFDGLDWIEQAKLTASDDASSDYFGISVSISGDLAVIGAYGDNSRRGSAYTFRFDGLDWIEQVKLTASDAAENDYFGNSVSISGDMAVIAAYLDDDGGISSGSAYVCGRFSDCQPNGISDVCDIASGTSQDVNTNGIPDECEQDCPGDLDGDGDVDLSDLAQLLSNYGMTAGAVYEDGDLDGDGDVDLSDLAELLAHYGQVCD